MNTEESKSDLYLVYVLTMSGISEWGMRLNEQDKRIYGVKRLDLKGIYNLTSEEEEQLKMNFQDQEDELYGVDLQEELEILTEAYHNAYLVATNRLSVDELVIAHGDMILLPFDPEDPTTLPMIIDDMIDFFSDEEEYEKCSELVKVKNKIRHDA